MQSIDAVIVAGGAGKRLGSAVPKAFVDLAGKPLFMHSLLCFDSHKSINSIIVAVPHEWFSETEKAVSAFRHEKKILLVAGGGERWQSVLNGVNASGAEWVLVHDAARPFVTHAVVDSVLEKRGRFDCVVTVTAEVDTIRRFENDRALGTVDRGSVARVGTPQLFKTPLLKNAFSKAKTLDRPPTDEAVLVEALGVAVGIAWGDPLNFKITTPGDLMLAEALCARFDIRK